MFFKATLVLMNAKLVTLRSSESASNVRITVTFVLIIMIVFNALWDTGSTKINA